MTETTSTNIRSEFGSNVRAERARKGWTQEDLAQSAGIAESYVGRVERGEASPSIVAAVNLANALGVEIGALIDGGRT